MEDRLNRFLEDNTDLFETSTGILLNEKNLKDFKVIYRELFMEEVEMYLKALKKAKDEEERERIKRDGCRRKPQERDSKKK